MVAASKLRKPAHNVPSTKDTPRPHFLVIGSGIAGLFFALKAARHGTVTIVTKDRVDNAATTYAQGGIAAALGTWDDPEKHKADTLVAGAGLCDEGAVDILVRDGVQRVQELIDLGMPFTPEVQLAVFAARERHAEVDQLLHALYAIAHENIDSAFVA